MSSSHFLLVHDSHRDVFIPPISRGRRITGTYSSCLYGRGSLQGPYWWQRQPHKVPKTHQELKDTPHLGFEPATFRPALLTELQPPHCGVWESRWATPWDNFEKRVSLYRSLFQNGVRHKFSSVCSALFHFWFWPCMIHKSWIKNQLQLEVCTS